MAHSLGVISDPDVTSKPLDEFDKILILATDGVWDIVSNQVLFLKKNNLYIQKH